VTNWMPTRLRDKRGPLRRQGRRTHGVMCAMAWPTAVQSNKATESMEMLGMNRSLR
jgi:hypothetical protein